MSARDNLCMTHTLEGVVRGDENVYMLVHATSHINEQCFSLICCSLCWLCLKKQTWTHTRYYTHTTGLCICKLNRKSCMELSWGWEGGWVWCENVVLEMHFNRTDENMLVGISGESSLQRVRLFLYFFFINSSEGMSESLISWRRARLMKLLLHYLQSIKTWLKNSIKMGKAMKNQRWCLQRSKINALSHRHHHEPPEY